MQHRVDPHAMNDEPALATALRALPAATPPDLGWERLATRIDRTRRHRMMLRIALPIALAAGVAVAIGLPRMQRMPEPAPRMARQVTPERAPDSGLAALRLQSQHMQAWVQALDRDGAPLRGEALATAVTLQDRIGLIDLQLTAARDPEARAALWQQRVALLARLGSLRLQPYVAVDRNQSTSNTTNTTNIL